MVTICTTSLTFTIPRSVHTVYLCVLCGSENKQRLFHCTALTGWLVCITETECSIFNLDIKDLYVNLTKQGIIQSTTFWLDKNNINKKIKEQVIHLLKVIIEQNYFQYNNQFFRPRNGIAMGLPLSGTLAEIYL